MMKVTVNEKEYVVRNPGQKEINKAKLESNKIFKKCLSSDEYFLREELYTILRKRGYWNDDKETELTQLRKDLNEQEEILKKGGIELDAAKDVALRLKLLRYQLILLTAKEREFDMLTVEAMADNAYFDYLVAESVFDSEGNKVFSSYQDYQDKKEEEYAYKCAETLSTMMFDFEDFEKKLPENEFLLEYGFMNDDLSLVETEEKVEEEKVEFKPFLRNGEPVQK